MNFCKTSTRVTRTQVKKQNVLSTPEVPSYSLLLTMPP